MEQASAKWRRLQRVRHRQFLDDRRSGSADRWRRIDHLPVVPRRHAGNGQHHQRPRLRRLRRHRRRGRRTRLQLGREPARRRERRH
ncbi:MAG: hypothetical protein ACK55Z_28070, partial [bacterium]